MASVLEGIENDIIARVKTIPYMQDVRGIVDPRTFLDLTSYPAPAVFVCFAGERAGKDETIGIVTQQSQMLWRLYVISSSFAPTAEGRLGAKGAYQMLEDIVAKLEGFQLGSVTSTTSKMLLVETSLFHVTDTGVIYSQTWRNNFLRTSS